jgi:regulator of protease activity HflC (stomatin/prohibitin superfamily)
MAARNRDLALGSGGGRHLPFGTAPMALTGAALLLLLLVLLFLSGAQVPEGYVGVKTTWGRAEEGILAPGFHLIIPGVQSIVRVETRVVTHALKDVDAASQELQQVLITGTLNYHVPSDAAYNLYRTVGTQFAERVIDPAFNDYIKEVIPKYAADQILARRDEIRRQAKDALGTNLERYGIVIDDIYIANIQYSKSYQEAIEKKQTAQQQVEAEKQVLAQKQIQAEQTVVEARGRGDAERARAEGQAAANAVLTASLTPQLIDYNRWAKWDGKMPQVVGAGASTLLNLPAPPQE